MESEPLLINQSELNDSNNSLYSFSNNYTNVLDKYFPNVRMSRKAFKNKPHITKGIQVSIRTRNKLYKKYLNNPTDVNKAAWKKSETRLVKLLKELNLYTTKVLSVNTTTPVKTFGKYLAKYSTAKKLNITKLPVSKLMKKTKLNNKKLLKPLIIFLVKLEVT